MWCVFSSWFFDFFRRHCEDPTRCILRTTALIGVHTARPGLQDKSYFVILSSLPSLSLSERVAKKSGRVVGDDGPVAADDEARTLPVWKTAAVLLVRSCKAGYGM